MMMSTWFGPNGINNYETRRRPFQCQKVVSVGNKESNDKKTALSTAASWAGLATLIVAAAVVVILILIYLGNKATASSTTSGLCPCEAFSNNSLFFPYGEEMGDFQIEGADQVTYLLPRKFECKPLGYNLGFYDAILDVYITNPRMEISCNNGNHRFFMTFTEYAIIDNPSSSNGHYFYHRKASKKENALFSCVIPDFEADEVYVFTWINATTNNYAEIVGSFQVVYLVAEDSTAYVIRNFGDDFVGIPGKQMVTYDAYGRLFDEGLFPEDVIGKREIMLSTEDVYGIKIPRTKEQEIGPCP